MIKSIGEVGKSNAYTTKIEITELGGKTYLDVRRYFKDRSGKFMPMRKGITLPIEILSELINLLERAESEVRTV